MRKLGILIPIPGTPKSTSHLRGDISSPLAQQLTFSLSKGTHRPTALQQIAELHPMPDNWHVSWKRLKCPATVKTGKGCQFKYYNKNAGEAGGRCGTAPTNTSCLCDYLTTGENA
jgi:hypothetical protein